MKKLSQILKPIAAPEYAEQRNHIHSQYKRMIAAGMDTQTALRHAKFSVDSLIGNYDKITYDDLQRDTITLCRKRDDGTVQIIAVCRPPKTPKGKATLEMAGSPKKRKFDSVLQAYDKLLKSIYKRYPDTFFGSDDVLSMPMPTKQPDLFQAA